MARYLSEQFVGRQQTDLNRLLVVSREVERLQANLEADRAVMSVLAAKAEEAAEVVQASLESAEHVLADAERDYRGIRAQYQDDTTEETRSRACTHPSQYQRVRARPAANRNRGLCLPRAAWSLIHQLMGISTFRGPHPQGCRHVRQEGYSDACRYQWYGQDEDRQPRWNSRLPLWRRREQVLPRTSQRIPGRAARGPEG